MPTEQGFDPLVDIIYHRDGALFHLSDDGPRRYEPEGNNHYLKGPGPEYGLDMGDHEFLISLVRNATSTSHPHLYLLRVTDQAYTGAAMSDFRCH